ncbi:PQQ-binding-like beta-propeller repeat protein [Pirellulales bacterium]|nr:PQQ-binding-like beta-propeller repeat protein [Pirellulales bacterium]
MRYLLLFLLIVDPCTGACAENWSRLRGPNGAGQGGDTVFPSQWTPDDYAWSVELPGPGHSSPVGWEDRIFITSGDPATGDVTLHCLDAASGQEHWKKRFSGVVRKMHENNTYAAATPAVDAGRVYVSYVSPEGTTLVATDHEGEVAWRRVLGAFRGDHGFAASPMIADGVVCIQIEQADRSGLAGVNADNGKIRWVAKRPAGKASYATPCVLESKSSGDPRTTVVDNAQSSGMRAIEVATGDVIWQLPNVFPDRCVSGPVIAGGVVFGVCGSGGGGKVLVGVDAHGTLEDPPQIHWQKKRQLPYVPTILADDNRVILWQDRGVVACFDLESQRASWDARVGGNYYGSPVVSGGKIYCISRDGQVVVIESAEAFILLGKNDLGEASNATPAIHDRRLYLRSETWLHCLEPIGGSRKQARESRQRKETDS